jgi:hydroxypyruvate isomerase
LITYAPNISWLLPERKFNERPAEVARLGFSAVEFGFPSHADLDALQAAREELGINIILFNQDVPVWNHANRGYLVDPNRRDEFHRTLDDALEIAHRLKVKKIMLPAGVELVEMTYEAQVICMLENLRSAAPLAKDADVLLTIEVLNPKDNPRYFLTSSRQAIDVVQQVNHPHVRFQFDSYHLQMMEGDLAKIIRSNIEWIGHIQFADFPGRHEPGTGSIDFHNLLVTINSAGYQGHIGLEYVPSAEGLSALDWVPAVMR